MNEGELEAAYQLAHAEDSGQGSIGRHDWPFPWPWVPEAEV